MNYCYCCLGTKLCLTLFDPVDCSPAGSSVHGIFWARILEWAAISFSRGSSWPRDQTQVSCTGRQILYHWGTREALLYLKLLQNNGNREINVCCLSHPATKLRHTCTGELSSQRGLSTCPLSSSHVAVCSLAWPRNSSRLNLLQVRDHSA